MLFSSFHWKFYVSDVDLIRSSHWRSFVKKVFLNTSQTSLENTCVGALDLCLKAPSARNVFKKILQHRFAKILKFEKFLRTPIQKNICKRLLLSNVFIVNLKHTQQRSIFHRYVKSVQILSFLWSVFSRIGTEYGEIRSISPYSIRMRKNTDQKKLRIWTLFTQYIVSDSYDGTFCENS